MTILVSYKGTRSTATRLQMQVVSIIKLAIFPELLHMMSIYLKVKF